MIQLQNFFPYWGLSCKEKDKRYWSPLFRSYNVSTEKLWANEPIRNSTAVENFQPTWRISSSGLHDSPTKTLKGYKCNSNLWTNWQHKITLFLHAIPTQLGRRQSASLRAFLDSMGYWIALSLTETLGLHRASGDNLWVSVESDSKYLQASSPKLMGLRR